MKNPQTTIARTFLTHIISGIGDVNFSIIGCNTYEKNSKPLPIYAIYLYDSVMLYAKALANVTSTKNVNGELILSSTL